VPTAQQLADISPFVLAAVVGLMLGLESLSPLVPLLPGRARAVHAGRNVALALCTAVFAVSGNLVLVGVSVWASAHHLGLMNLVETPPLVRCFVALAGIDFFEWVRHSDPHVDATTAIRGHPLESLLAYSYFSLIVLALGIDPFWLALRSLVAATALAFHHADLRLPPRLDAALSWVTPTPRTHRLHHAREVRFTDSNYGTLFTWWDRLLGTFHGGQSREPGVTGLNGFDAPQAQSVWGVLRSPLEDVAHDPLDAPQAVRLGQAP
jgi:hypothetical protein